MATAETDTTDDPPKRGKSPLITGLVLALLGAGGGFYATWSGVLLGAETPKEMGVEAAIPSEKVAYVEVDPLVISLNSAGTARLLRFRANLAVRPEAAETVSSVLPRVSDVLNTYLRALEPADLEDPAALARLRAQMLRRVQVVAGNGLVDDLLILEFVLT